MVVLSGREEHEIAKIRHRPTLASRFFDTDAEGLLRSVQQLRELSGGNQKEFEELEQMNILNIYPRIFTIDLQEGSGAAPPESSDGVGMPLEPALIFVNRTFDL